MRGEATIYLFCALLTRCICPTLGGLTLRWLAISSMELLATVDHRLEGDASLASLTLDRCFQDIVNNKYFLTSFLQVLLSCCLAVWLFGCLAEVADSERQRWCGLPCLQRNGNSNWNERDFNSGMALLSAANSCSRATTLLLLLLLGSVRQQQRGDGDCDIRWPSCQENGNRLRSRREGAGGP